jgi:hypothetical protein
MGVQFGGVKNVHEGPHPLSICAYFAIASFLLYLGVAVCFVSPGGYRAPLFEKALPVLVTTLPALLLTFRIAWILRRPESDARKARGLLVTIPLSLAGVMLGALLISVLIFRGSWSRVF